MYILNFILTFYFLSRSLLRVKILHKSSKFRKITDYFISINTLLKNNRYRT